MVVWGTCLWTCLWIGILRSKHLQAQFKVETVAFRPWTKLWVTVTPVEMSPVAMSHSSFDVYWSFWYMFVSLFVYLDLSSICVTIWKSQPRWWRLRSFVHLFRTRGPARSLKNMKVLRSYGRRRCWGLMAKSKRSACCCSTGYTWILKHVNGLPILRYQRM